MGKYYQAVFLLFFAALFSYAQDKIEKGTYFSTTPGQDIKLNLKEDNTYELVVFYGDFNVENDTIHLNNNHSNTTDFNVAFNSGANPGLGKVSVKIVANSLYAGIYVGSQSGKATPVFKSVAELAGSEDLEEKALQLEINRGDYFYIAKEEYDGEGTEATVLKYVLPRDANEIQIEYSPNYLAKIKLRGYLNEKKELVISEKSKRELLSFVPENRKPKALESQVAPLETKVQKNWTYPGKKELYDYGMAIDTVAAISNFKFSIQDDLKKAQEITRKTPEKFLVVVYDPGSQQAKAQFDKFIRNQEYAIGPYVSYENIAYYDKYNYYLANSKDKAWASKNKIKDNPSIIIIDGDGNVLSQTKGSISDNASLFEIYNPLDKSLQQTRALINLEKAINSKASAPEIIRYFALLSANENEYDPPVVESAVMEPPMAEGPASEVEAAVAKTDSIGKEDAGAAEAEVIEAVDYPANAPNETVFSKPVFDKKKMLSVWDKVVKSHAGDIRPDMDFVKVVLAEIQNKGFYLNLFKEERLFDETNFQAIEYLLKHYDAILAQQAPQREQDDIYREDVYPSKTIKAILPYAISGNVAMMAEQTPAAYQKRMLDVYKKTIEKAPEDIKGRLAYFSTLEAFSRKMNVEEDYVAEYDQFFNNIFKGKTNEIEVLDLLYSSKIASNLEYDDWISFKNYFSRSSNEAAWFVVEKSKNPEYVKKAIKWSESSLRIQKDDPYYLDTLAQLYYKNGEKQKAIAAQEKAVALSSELNDETKKDLEEVLAKMRSGTY
ncbi:MAG TPA: hypothetical protein VFR70_01960 [Flavobacterium sp.]|nr:hypothetical protein [Flavobacterium sp.]